jgi:hypothetical protein
LKNVDGNLNTKIFLVLAIRAPAGTSNFSRQNLALRDKKEFFVFEKIAPAESYDKSRILKAKKPFVLKMSWLSLSIP